MKDALKTLLLADATVGEMIADIYDSVLPRGYKFPAACWHIFGGTEPYDMSGPIATIETELQIDCYGASALSARTLANAVKAVLKPLTGTLSDGTNVQACFLTRDLDMPYQASGDAKGITFRVCLQFNVIHN
jgi:hypothetical protein